MTEAFETDRLEVGADMDIINAAATDLGIEATERQKVLAELLPYLAAKGKIATLKILETYLKLSTELTKTASQIVQGKGELVATHGQGVNLTLVRHAAHIEEALTGGHLLKEGEADSFLLDSMRQGSVDSLISTIGRETEASEDSGFYGRIVRKERTLEEEYRQKAARLVTAAETFERRNPDCIAALTQALSDDSLERVFELMDDPSNIPNTASVSSEATGTASMREGTAGRRENPIDGLMNLVRELERLDRFARTRAETDINAALRKHDVGGALSDTMNRALNLKFRVLLDRVPPVTRREEIAKERTLHEDQIGVLEEIKAFLDMRPQAIRAQHAVVENGLGGHLEDYRRRAATSPGSDTPTLADSTQDTTVLKTISGEITQLEESLPDLEEAIVDRLEEIRGIVPDIRLNRTEVGASIHNFRQFVFAVLALVGAGVLTFAAGRYIAPDGIDSASVQTATAAADTAGFARGHTTGRTEGEGSGRQAAIAELATALGLQLENPTVDTIVAAIAASETNTLEDRKNDLKEIIRIAIEKGMYRDQAEALDAAKIASVDNLQTAEEAVTAIQNLLGNLSLYGRMGRGSTGAVTLQQGIEGLDEGAKSRLRRDLQEAGLMNAAQQVR